MKLSYFVLFGLSVLLYAHCTDAVCYIDEFECNNGRCIPGRNVCDGKDDCKDGSDEAPQENLDQCPPCREGQFQCAYGGCIRIGWVCDGALDCRDGSDELSDRDLCPPCTANQFRCEETQRCINETWVCNGKNECIDGSDERQDCGSCSGGRFQCAIGGCIPSTYICDRENDCLDFSDESTETCPCSSSEVRCDTEASGLPGLCIPASAWCDSEGIWDCPDGSDQKNCP